MEQEKKGPEKAPRSMDFLQIKKGRYGVAAMPTRWGGGAKFPEYTECAYGDAAILWFLAFESHEDAQAWLNVTAMEF